jgi:hypothetical protein
MIFTPQQIVEILQIVDRYTLTFVAHHVSPDILSDQDKEVLRSSGIDLTGIPIDRSNVTQAFKFGILSTTLQDPTVRSMSYQQFKSYLSSGKMFSLNPLELSALNNLQYQTYRDVSKLSGKVKDDITDTLVHADRKNHTVKHSKTVTDAARRAVENRKGVADIVSTIGRKTEKWDKDLGRIADFTLHTAFDEGRAMGYVKEKGDHAIVYKDVYPGACPHCIRAFLKGGAGSEPKLFKVSELRANGTNVGKKVGDWLPVIGPHHPWCRCTLMDTPRGFTVADYNAGKWYWNGKDFERDMSKFERKVNRNSKVNVTVNGKTTQI